MCIVYIQVKYIRRMWNHNLDTVQFHKEFYFPKSQSTARLVPESPEYVDSR